MTFISSAKMFSFRIISWCLLFYLSTADNAFAGHFLENADVAERACGSQRPALLTEPAIIFGPLLDENGTYVQNLTCHWLIQAPVGSVIRLEFPVVDMQPTFRCLHANLTVYDSDVVDNDHYLERLCATDNSPVMHSSYTSMLVVFLSGRDAHGVGFLANYTFIAIMDEACFRNGLFVMTNWTQGGFTTPNWPENYPSRSACSWRIDSTTPVRLEFVSFSLEDVSDSDPWECLSDSLEVVDGISMELIHDLCGTYLPPPVGVMSTSMLIEFQSDLYTEYLGVRARFKALNITEWACSQNRPAEIDFSQGLIESPGTESSNCHWRLHAYPHTMIQVRIQTFDLPECSNCECAWLDVFDGDSHNSPRIGRFCGDSLSQTTLYFAGSSAYFEYDSFSLAPHTGFTLEYQFLDTSEYACDNIKPFLLTHSTGFITSPNFGRGDYYDELNCHWMITAPFGWVVVLEFLHVELEYCNLCNCDRLIAYNGASDSSSLEMDTWCGTQTPRPVSTAQSDAYLVFETDSSRASVGFRIKYTQVLLSNRACRQDTSDPAFLSYAPGTILSPGYETNDSYTPNSLCRWSISSQDFDGRIVLTVVDMDLSPECDRDYVDVYDGPDDRAKVLDRLCYRDRKTIRSTGMHMYLEFVSNRENEASGFHLSYTFEDKPEEGAISTVGVVFIVLGILLFIVFVGTVRLLIDKTKRFLTGRRSRSSDSQYPDAVQMQDDSRPSGLVSAPAYGTDIDRPPAYTDQPPSEVDNEIYFAIANYPPPTYDEAMTNESVTNRNGHNNSLSHVTESGSTHFEAEGRSAGNNVQETSFSHTGHYPNRNRQRSVSSNQGLSPGSGTTSVSEYPNTSQSERFAPQNSHSSGNPDLGFSLIQHTCSPMQRVEYLSNAYCASGDTSNSELNTSSGNSADIQTVSQQTSSAPREEQTTSVSQPIERNVGHNVDNSKRPEHKARGMKAGSSKENHYTADIQINIPNEPGDEAKGAPILHPSLKHTERKQSSAQPLDYISLSENEGVQDSSTTQYTIGHQSNATVL